MSFETYIDPQAALAAEEAANGGDGTFPPLPRGKYQAHIVKIEGVDQYAKSGDNADPNKKVVRLRLQIVPESPTGKGRIFFARIPLFSRFAPTEKNPQGSPVRDFWDFWERAIGVPREAILAGQPMPSEITGRQITITLSAPIPPNEYNPLGYNEIAFYDAAADIASTPPNVLNVPWLDANNNIIQSGIPGAGQFATGGAPQPAQQANPFQAAPAANPFPAAAPAAFPTQPQAPAAFPAAPPAPPAPQAQPQAPAQSPWNGYENQQQPAFPGQVTAPPAAFPAPPAPPAPAMPGVSSTDPALSAALGQGGSL